MIIELNDWDSLPINNGIPWSYSPLVRIDYSPIRGSSPSGGSALRMTYPAGHYNTSVTGGIMTYDFQTPLREIYVGHWLMFTSNSDQFSWNPIAQKIDYVIGDEGSSYNHTSNSFRVGDGGWGLNGDNTAYGLAGVSGQRWDSNGGIVFQPSRWYWFQFRFKQSSPATPNGIIEVWVDGQKLVGLYDRVLNMSDQPISSFSHSPEWGGGGGVIAQEQYIYFDHTVIATTKQETDKPNGQSTQVSVPIQIQQSDQQPVSVQNIQLPVRPALLLSASDIPTLQSNVQQPIQQTVEQPVTIQQTDSGILPALIAGAIAYFSIK